MSNKVKEITLQFTPAIELEEYNWLKVGVTGTFTGSKKIAFKKLELMYWELVFLNMKIEDEVQESYKDGGEKALKKLVKKKMEKCKLVLHKQENENE